MSDLTVERLRELLDYDPETGVFRWKVSRQRINIGDVAGYVNFQGYRKIGIDGRHYKAARLAWLYVTGQWPVPTVDHINTVPSDDRIANLREANGSQQNGNTRRPSHNKSGFKGVRWGKRTRKWWARIYVKRRQIYLGRFATAEEAHAAYCEAAKQHFGQFARFQ